MSLINKLANFTATDDFRITEQLITQRSAGKGYTDISPNPLAPIEPMTAMAVSYALKARKRYFIVNAVWEAINQMSEKELLGPEYLPFLNHAQNTWYEWNNINPDAKDAVKGRVGVLVLRADTLIPDGMNYYKDDIGYTAVALAETAGGQIGRYPVFKIAKEATNGQLVTFAHEHCMVTQDELRKSVTSQANALNSLFLLLHSEASPVVIQESGEDLSALNKKRAQRGKPPLATLPIITIDLSKLGSRREEAENARNKPDELRRICVEHIVHSHCQVYHTSEGPKLRFISDYKRYEGSPKGSIVDQPRNFRVIRSNPNSHHKLRGPDGLQLL